MTEAERLTELEMRIAYLEDTLQTLDTVIARQADEIALLTHANRRLSDQFRAVQEHMETQGPAAPEPPPPHY